jgi:hypothetical protein
MRRRIDLDRVTAVASQVVFPVAVYKTCPWQPRDLVETGLRQWLRCCGAALRDDRVIGMPSRAVDEAWHGFILCTARYATFCDEAYGRFLHHHPDDGGAVPVDDPAAQLGRTVVAWSMVAREGEQCVLWDLDEHVGVAQPWGVPAERVAEVQHNLINLQES